MARILETVFIQTKEPAKQALNALLPHLPRVTRKWKKALRTLSLTPEARRMLGGLDLKHGFERFPGMTYGGLRNGLKQLSAELAAAGIESEQALGAFYLLLDECLPYFEHADGSSIAVPRLAGVVAGMMVAGYSARWESSRLFLSHRLVDAQRRLLGASAYVTQVYEIERTKLAHDLHDDIGHDLMLLKLYLEVLLRDLHSMEPRVFSPDVLRPKVVQTLDVVQHAIDSARRLVLDLGPPIFDELGFLPAIQSYAHQFGERTGLEVDFRAGPLPDEIPMSHQVALYRVVQGALGNVFKHAHASHVLVTLGRVRNGELFMVVEDNGTGFDMTAPRKEASVGLIAMRERIEVLGGTFRIESSLAGTLQRKHRTRIEVGLPLPRVDSLGRKRKRAS
jgi:signal transduction histidine kinase